MDWYVLTLVSVVFYTIHGLLFKFAAMKKCDKMLTTLYYLFTVALISVPFLLFYGLTKTAYITYIGIAMAVIDGIFYAINIIARIEALKHIQASILYPIIRLNNAVLVIIFVLFFGEILTFQNFIGVILAVASLFLLSKGEKTAKTIGKGVRAIEERL